MPSLGGKRKVGNLKKKNDRYQYTVNAVWNVDKISLNFATKSAGNARAGHGGYARCMGISSHGIYTHIQTIKELRFTIIGYQ